MARKLNTYVHAVERDDKGEVINSGTFGPDDDLGKPENAWVEKAVTNPDVWQDGDGDKPAEQMERPRRTPPVRATDTK